MTRGGLQFVGIEVSGRGVDERSGQSLELVERFERNREDYKSGRFNEAQAQ